MWGTALAEWRDWLVVAGRPQSTIKLRMYQMRRFAEEHKHPWKVTNRAVTEWLAAQSWSSESRRSYRSALRSFYGWGVLAGHTDTNPALLLPAIKPSEPRPRPTPEQVLSTALAKADPRVRLIILLAAKQGLRRGEIAQIHSSDVTKGLSGWSLRVHGKGNKDRVVPLHDDIAWMLRELNEGWAFPSQLGGHISPRWVGTLVKRMMPEGWTTHCLRHRFATIAYSGSRDLLAVQELLGHSKPETTRRYVQLPDDAMRAAMKWAA
jgi:integrase/recombinase XerC